MAEYTSIFATSGTHPLILVWSLNETESYELGVQMTVPIKEGSITLPPEELFKIMFLDILELESFDMM